MKLVNSIFTSKWIILFTIIHFTLTFLTDELIFIKSPNYNIVHYFICKILLLIILFYVWSYILSLKLKTFLASFVYYAPFIIIFAIAIAFKTMNSWDDGDCRLMYEHAIRYDPWPEIFTYIQGYLYIISYMLIPSKYAVLIIEILIYTVVLGYGLKRLSSIIKNKYIPFLYILIIVPLVLTTLPFIPHRLPIYTPIYVLFLSIPFFDWIEQKDISKVKFIGLSLLAALLSQWRVEGAYLILLFPMILYFAYNSMRGKLLVRAIACFFIFVLLVALPQYAITLSGNSDYLKTRSSPIYTWTISTMILNGLDENKNAEDMAIIDKYMSIETVHKMNTDMGENSYRDEYINFKYHGLNLEADDQIVSDFIRSSQDIIFNNLSCFLISRINAFKFLAETKLYNGKVINIAVNLYIPIIICFVAFIITLFKKQWLLMLLVAAPLIHLFITLLLLPAAYFKYFYVPFFAGWQIIMISTILLFDRCILTAEKR